MNPINEILSIDDSKAVHAFIEHCLEGTNYKLTHAYNGKDGIDTIKQNPEKFSLVLLDWEMPGMTGPETFDQMIAQKISIPVIMITSKNDLNDISVMLEKGAKEYILKPFTPDIIIEKIQSVLG